MKVIGIIVAYNPSKGEIENAIKRLILQVDNIIIGNNSDYPINIDKINNVSIINFNENLGIAKAQNICMKKAFDLGADFVVQMDQDSELETNSIKRLINSYNLLVESGYKVGVIGPKPYDKIDNLIENSRVIKGDKIPNTSLSIESAIISSSSLIPKKVYKDIGGLDDGLFIDAVDWEYCWRLKKNGYLSIRDNSIFLAHRVGNGKKKIFGNIKISAPSPLRHYYQSRNLILLSKRNYVPLYWKLSNVIKISLKLPLFLFFWDDGIERFKFIIKGIKDGFRGKEGKIG